MAKVSSHRAIVFFLVIVLANVSTCFSNSCDFPSSLEGGFFGLSSGRVNSSVSTAISSLLLQTTMFVPAASCVGKAHKFFDASKNQEKVNSDIVIL